MSSTNSLPTSSPLKNYLEGIYGVKLSEQEFNQYKSELLDVFSLLIEVDRRNKKSK